MASTPESTISIPSLPLPGGASEHFTRLQELEVALEAATQGTILDDGRGDMESIHSLVWDRFELWAECRARADLPLPFQEYGQWQLEADEFVYLNTGFVHPKLAAYGDESSDGAVERLYGSFQVDPKRQLLPLTGFLARAYRGILGVEQGIEQHDQIASIEAELAERRGAADAIRAQMSALIESEEQCETLQPLHDQLQSILLPLARVRRVTQKGRVSSEDHRTEMKVRELAQRVRVLIQNEIPTFGVRKQYEEFDKQLLGSLIEILDTEALLAEAKSALDVHYSEDTIVDAVHGALAECKRVMRNLLNSEVGECVPFALDRLPRWTSADVMARWGQLLDEYPVFKSQDESGLRPDLVLLPGRGDCYFDVKASCAVASLFPLEAKLRSIDVALAQAYFALNDSMRASLSKVARVDATDTERLCKTFRRHYEDYRNQSSEADPFMKNWMRNQLEPS